MPLVNDSIAPWHLKNEKTYFIFKKVLYKNSNLNANGIDTKITERRILKRKGNIVLH